MAHLLSTRRRRRRLQLGNADDDDDERSALAGVQHLVRTSTRRRPANAPTPGAANRFWKWLSVDDKREQLVSHRVAVAMRFYQGGAWRSLLGGVELYDRERRRTETEVDGQLERHWIYFAEMMEELDDYLIAKAVQDPTQWLPALKSAIAQFQQQQHTMPLLLEWK